MLRLFAGGKKEVCVCRKMFVAKARGNVVKRAIAQLAPMINSAVREQEKE
jgi:hypothetical protein